MACKTQGCLNPKVHGRGNRYCEPCAQSVKAARAERRKPAKPCANCGESKTPGGGRKYCDDCSPKCASCDRYSRSCSDCNSASMRRNQRMRNMGLTVDEMIELESIKKCEVCGSTHRLCVDHDHVTGKVRGVLCDGCNKALGHARDNTKILEGLISYLTERS